MRRWAFYQTTVVLCLAAALSGGSASAQPPILQPTNVDGLLPVETGGFGDPGNTWAGSMKWFKGNLYVGSHRWTHCVVAATLAAATRLPLYPPSQSDCAPDPKDLTLSAEIWRFSPTDLSWEQVFVSPEDVPIAVDEILGNPTAFTARDIAFPSMEVFIERDGTEALYVGGMTSAAMFAREYTDLGGAPPPRILRTVNGSSWIPVAQDPGTFFGDLGQPLPGSSAVPTGFTSLLDLGGNLVGLLQTSLGAGTIVESSQPFSGNNTWAAASPPPEEFPVTAAARFNGALYLGVGLAGGADSYAIYRSDLGFMEPIVTNEGIPGPFIPQSVTSFTELDGRLYAGTSWPPELIRIDKDDSWEMLVGQRRPTTDGLRSPASGIPAGFGNALNVQFNALGSHGGSLYAGSTDASQLARFLPFSLGSFIGYEFGFDLLRSEDGIYWHPVSRNALGDSLQYGVQSFESTPEGLFVGTSTGTGGAQVWLGGEPTAVGPAAPYRTEAASATLTTGEVVLSWEPVPNAVAYHVYRSTVIPLSDVPGLIGGLSASASMAPADFNGAGAVCDLAPEFCLPLQFLMNDVGIPGPFVWTAVTTDPFYVEPAPTQLQSVYYVLSEQGGGELSGPSNIVGGASTAPPITFPVAEAELTLRLVIDDIGPELWRALTFVRRAAHAVNGGNFSSARRMLELCEQYIDSQRGVSVSDVGADDLCLMVYRLRRNVQLAEWSLIPTQSIM